MTVFEYEINNQWFGFPNPVCLTLPTMSREIERHLVHRTIVQVLRPPYHLRHESSVVIRAAWEEGVHFPSIWNARPDIYKNPYVVIIGPVDQLLAARVRHRQPPHATQARYVALIETPDDLICNIMLNNLDNIPNDAKLLGVFERHV